MTGFACNRCGACCRLIGEVPELAHLDRGDKSCVHLRGEPGDDHACAIYEDRPKQCRVDEGCPPVMQLAAWYRLNHQACEALHLRVYGGAHG